MIDPDSVGGVTRSVECRLRKAGITSARLDARLLLACALEIDATQVFMYPERQLTDHEKTTVSELLSRREKREPLSHILGKREFWGLSFKVSSAVLTPRPDSETLIEAALATFPDRRAALNVLDLGTGSGCLLLSMLSEYPFARGVGIDISPEALDVARSNAEALDMTGRTEFVLGSWDDGLNGCYDVIFGNPPYIPDDEIDHLAPEVARYEPRLALSGGADGLDCYRALVPVMRRHLAARGRAFVEVGAGQADPVRNIFTSGGMIVMGVVPDLGGIARCVSVHNDRSISRRD